MKTHLVKINSLLSRFDDETLALLQSIAKVQIIKKGDYLLKQGEVCRDSFLLKQGIARKYYLNDGKEITTELFFEDDLAIAFNSYCTQQPGREFIQAVTDITVSATNHADFQKAKQEFPQIMELDLLLTEYYAMWVEDRLFQLRTLTATDRYTLLLREHPHFIQHLPLNIIASYLGISLETLSRIRAKL
jgi:CRP-like cAMP-binding protein